MSADTLPDLDGADAEALALGKCYALARNRARELRQRRENENPIADTFAGQAATGPKQDNLKRSSHGQSYTGSGA
jgi:hypothetical protein